MARDGRRVIEMSGGSSVIDIADNRIVGRLHFDGVSPAVIPHVDSIAVPVLDKPITNADDWIQDNQFVMSTKTRSTFINCEVEQEQAARVRSLEGMYAGKKALLVLGGASAKNWRQLRGKLQPDVIACVNGAITEVDSPDVWLAAEHNAGDASWWLEGNKAKYKFIHFGRFTCPAGKEFPADAYGIDRIDADSFDVNLRKYEKGLLMGGIYEFGTRGDGKSERDYVGTVGSCALHLLGILGVDEIHTIGFDLCFKDDMHHWYKEFQYVEAPHRPFKSWNGVNTTNVWYWTAYWFKRYYPNFAEAGITWIDHSDGLLQKMGVFD